MPNYSSIGGLCYQSDVMIEAKVELESLQKRHEQFLKENQSDINNTVELQDTNTLYNELERYRHRQLDSKSLGENELIEFADDTGYTDEDETVSELMYNVMRERKIADCNNNVDDFNESVGSIDCNMIEKQFSSRGEAPDVDGVIGILEDLDTCLDNSINHELDNDESDSKVESENGQYVSDSTLFTSPPRLHKTCHSFDSVVDSVLVNKKRLSDSLGHHVEFNAECQPDNSAVKSLAYDTDSCDFVNFSKVSDLDGHAQFVPKPVDCQDSFPPHFVRSTPTNRFSNTYLASLNKSGHLSPFMRSIAGKYELFDKRKSHFKTFDLELPEPLTSDIESEVSYGSLMFGHHAEVQTKPNPRPEQLKKVVADMTPSVGNASPSVNRMLNNYVYEVLIGKNRVNSSDQTIGLSASDIELRSATDVNSSMAVCFDDSSVSISKQELSDESTEVYDDESRSILISVYEDACPMPIDSCWDKSSEDELAPQVAVEDVIIVNTSPFNVSAEPYAEDVTNHLITLFEREGEFIRIDDERGTYPLADHIQELNDRAHLETQNTDKKTQTKVDGINWKTDQDLTSHRQHSSYCRIPFGNTASTFWFCKDFEMSPVSKTRVRSPKRSCCDLKPMKERDDLKNVLNTYNLSSAAEHWSPAKKRRRHNAADCGFNVSSNACAQKPLIPSEKTTLEKASQTPTCGCGHLKKQRKSSMRGDRSSAQPYTKSENSELENSLIHSYKTPLKPNELFFTGSVESASMFMDVCSEKRQKRGLFGRSKSLGLGFDTPVTLLNYRKIEDNNQSPAREALTPDRHSNRPLEKSSPNSENSFKYDPMFKLHPDCLKRYMVEPSHNTIHPSSSGQDDDEDESTVGLFFHQDEESEEDLTDYKNCSDTNGEDDYFVEFDNDNRTISDTDQTKHNFTTSRDSRYTLESILEGRNKLYSAISEAVKTCSEIVSFTSEKTTQSAHSSREDMCDSTPDAELLMQDLQGLDLSETPKYANEEAMESEVNAMLCEALESLDSIMSESFSFSMESPEKDQPKNQDVSETLTDNTEAEDDFDLAVIGQKCILHDISACSEKVIMPDIADTTIEVINDSVLNVEGTKCILYDQDEASNNPYCLAVKYSATHYPEHDEVHELEDEPVLSNVDNAEKNKVSDSVGRSLGRSEYNRYHEKQPSYFCIDRSMFADTVQEVTDTGEVTLDQNTSSNAQGVSTMNGLDIIEPPKCSQHLDLCGVPTLSGEEIYIIEFVGSRLSETDADENLDDVSDDIFITSSIEETLSKHVNEEDLNAEVPDDIEWPDEADENVDESSLNLTRGSSLETDVDAFEKQTSTI